MGRKKSIIHGYTLAHCKGDYLNYIEYNCMNPRCEFMWDQHKDRAPTELCPNCGSNNLHTMHRPPQLRFNEAVYDHYQGPDIYDQYQKW